jgi:hypothetical protein
MNEASDEPIDIVYTWVDDSFPGYLEELGRYATDGRDRNPNRTRDNLDVLRFSLRSLASNVGFYRNVYIVSCRPQVPAWLDAAHPQIRVVHHDQVIDAKYLPTFSSFAIVSHLHLLPGLSRRFVYVEDDCLIWSPLRLSHLTSDDGRPFIFFNPRRTRRHQELDRSRASSWNLALATAEDALDREFGERTRTHVIHGPLLIDRALFSSMLDRFSAEIAATRTARFRADGTVPPEYLYVHTLAETGEGVVATGLRMEGYVSLENFLPWTWLQLRLQQWRRPLTMTLNDGFGECPHPGVVRHVRKWLEMWFPEPSPFERTVPAGPHGTLL